MDAESPKWAVAEHGWRAARYLCISLMMLTVLAVVEGLILRSLEVPIRGSSSIRTVSRFTLGPSGGGAAIYRYFGNARDQCWTEAVVFLPDRWTEFRQLDCAGLAPVEIACSPVDERIAVACEDGTVLLYSDEDASPTVLGRQASGVDFLAFPFAPNGRFLASVGRSGVTVWDLDGNTSVHMAANERLTCAAFSSDSRHIITGSRSGDISLWDVASGDKVASFADHGDAVVQVLVSPTGEHLASTGENLQLRVWEIATGRLLWSRPIEAFSYLPMDFSPDGRMLAAATGDWWANWTVPLLDAATGHECGSFELTSEPVQLNYAADQRLYARTSDGGLHVLSLDAAPVRWRLTLPARVLHHRPAQEKTG